MIKEAPKEVSESIKLIKNSKGYGWEIRILSVDIDKLDNLNEDMLKRFSKDGAE